MTAAPVTGRALVLAAGLGSRLRAIAGDRPKPLMPFGGATVANLSPAVADQLGLDPFDAGSGVMITKVEDGVAANLGLQPGDLIKEVNGVAIKSTAQLQGVLAAGGSVWRFTLTRNGQTMNAQVRL